MTLQISFCRIEYCKGKNRAIDNGMNKGDLKTIKTGSRTGKTKHKAKSRHIGISKNG